MRKLTISIGLAALVLLGAILFIVTDTADREFDIPEEELRTATEDPTLRFQERMNDIEFEDWRDVLADYRKWAVYPPHSRPLEEGQEDLIVYRKINLPERSMPAIQNGELIDTGAHCRFQPDRHTITEGESVLISLRCTKDDQPVAVNISRAKVTRVGDQGPLPARGEFDYNDEGKNGDERANDDIYTFSFQPQKSDQGDMSLDIAFTLSGVAPESFVHEMKASFFSSPTAPARFTGKVDETLEDGSLVFSVEIDVKKSGWYSLEGNLFDMEDQPVAYAREKLKLGTGVQKVRLLYFGKVLRDKKSYGPFKLVGVRGERDNSGVDLDRLKNGTVAEVEEYLSQVKQVGPMKEQMPYLPAAFESQEYQESDFSDREYDSPAKRDRIALLSSFVQ